MKQYVIDELRPADYQKLKQHLHANFLRSDIDGVYWTQLEEALLSDVQASHAACKPFYFVIAIEAQMMSCELLVRTHNRISCNCIAYADESQRNWIIRLADGLLENLDIKV